MAEKEQTKYVIGPYEEGKKWVGRESEPWEACVTVTKEAIEHFCEAIEDPNPLYWSDKYAAKTKWGERVAPSAMMTVWTMVPMWRPEWMETKPQRMLVSEVPLPGGQIIATQFEMEYFRHARVGDKISMKQRLTGIEPTTSRVFGKAHNVMAETEYINQKGEVIGVSRSVLLRYTATK